MKKLRLNVEKLTVESFDTSRAHAMPGTVAAHSDEPVPTLDASTCQGNPEWTCRYHCTWYPGTTCEA